MNPNELILSYNGQEVTITPSPNLTFSSLLQQAHDLWRIKPSSSTPFHLCFPSGLSLDSASNLPVLTFLKAHNERRLIFLKKPPLAKRTLTELLQQQPTEGEEAEEAEEEEEEEEELNDKENQPVIQSSQKVSPSPYPANSLPLPPSPAPIYSQLWRIYTNYCLLGMKATLSSTAPISCPFDSLSSTHFVKLLEDCQIIPSSPSTSSSPPSSSPLPSFTRHQADLLHLTLTKKFTNKFPFEAFLSALSRTACAAYKFSSDPELLLDSLLLNHLLPLASRYNPMEHQPLLAHAGVRGLMERFDGFHSAVFACYQQGGWIGYSTFMQWTAEVKLTKLIAPAEISRCFLSAIPEGESAAWWAGAGKLRLDQSAFSTAISRLLTQGLSRKHPLNVYSMKALYQQCYNNPPPKVVKAQAGERKGVEKMVKALEAAFLPMWKTDGKRDYLLAGGQVRTNVSVETRGTKYEEINWEVLMEQDRVWATVERGLRLEAEKAAEMVEGKRQRLSIGSTGKPRPVPTAVKTAAAATKGSGRKPATGSGMQPPREDDAVFGSPKTPRVVALVTRTPITKKSAASEREDVEEEEDHSESEDEEDEHKEEMRKLEEQQKAMAAAALERRRKSMEVKERADKVRKEQEQGEKEREEQRLVAEEIRKQAEREMQRVAAEVARLDAEREERALKERAHKEKEEKEREQREREQREREVAEAHARRLSRERVERAMAELRLQREKEAEMAKQREMEKEQRELERLEREKKEAAMQREIAALKEQLAQQQHQAMAALLLQQQVMTNAAPAAASSLVKPEAEEEDEANVTVIQRPQQEKPSGLPAVVHLSHATAGLQSREATHVTPSHATSHTPSSLSSSSHSTLSFTSSSSAAISHSTIQVERALPTSTSSTTVPPAHSQPGDAKHQLKSAELDEDKEQDDEEDDTDTAHHMQFNVSHSHASDSEEDYSDEEYSEEDEERLPTPTAQATKAQPLAAAHKKDSEEEEEEEDDDGDDDVDATFAVGIDCSYSVNQSMASALLQPEEDVEAEESTVTDLDDANLLVAVDNSLLEPSLTVSTQHQLLSHSRTAVEKEEEDEEEEEDAEEDERTVQIHQPGKSADMESSFTEKHWNEVDPSTILREDTHRREEEEVEDGEEDDIVQPAEFDEAAHTERVRLLQVELKERVEARRRLLRRASYMEEMEEKRMQEELKSKQAALLQLRMLKAKQLREMEIQRQAAEKVAAAQQADKAAKERQAAEEAQAAKQSEAERQKRAVEEAEAARKSEIQRKHAREVSMDARLLSKQKVTQWEGLVRAVERGDTFSRWYDSWWSKPKPKFLRVSIIGKEAKLWWGSDMFHAEKHIDLAEVVEVVTGGESKIAGRLPMDQLLCAFTLVTEERQIHLVAASHATREVWMTFFTRWLQQFKAEQAMQQKAKEQRKSISTTAATKSSTEQVKDGTRQSGGQVKEVKKSAERVQ